MAWLIRNGNAYYYRSRRVGQRVISEYVGPGLLGELAEADDVAQRIARQTAREAWWWEQEQLAALDQQMHAVHSALVILTRGVLYAHDFYRHSRGEWRKHAASAHPRVD